MPSAVNSRATAERFQRPLKMILIGVVNWLFDQLIKADMTKIALAVSAKVKNIETVAPADYRVFGIDIPGTLT
jgi:hypothetical protein